MLINLKKEISKLLKEAAITIPQDIEKAIRRAARNEKNSRALNILKIIIKNIELAQKERKPLCQDTGVAIFYISLPEGHYPGKIRKMIREATQEATREIPLRANTVEPLTGKNLGNLPLIYLTEGKKLKIDLMLKGGGSENITQIYSLPTERNFKGIEKCVLDALLKAQGKGCPPYIIGLAVGGDQEQVVHLAKKQLLRKIDDKNANRLLAQLEKRLLVKINRLGLGPMGLGGWPTALGVKITTCPRHRASFFVGVSFSCWCLRRASL